MFLHVHEDKGGEFKSTNNHFHGSPCISTSAPRVFDIGDFIGVNTKCLGKHGMTLFNTFFHPIDHFPILWPIEHVVRHHFEGREVST